jgi:retron-type reverse transcriptase
VRDGVVQMAAKLVLEPIFEAEFLPWSYRFRPRRSTTMALEELRGLGAKRGHYVLDADIRDYFGSIDHEKLATERSDLGAGAQAPALPASLAGSARHAACASACVS